MSPLQPPNEGCQRMEYEFPSSSRLEKEVLLHGTLDVWIHEARELPNMDLVSEHVRRCWTFFARCTEKFIKTKQRQHPPRHHKIITSDPYVSIRVAGTTVAQTSIIPNNQNPKWEEHFYVELAHYASNIEFIVKDNDYFGADFIGTVKIPAQKLFKCKKIEDWFPVLTSSGKPPKPNSSLFLTIAFLPLQTDSSYSSGVGVGGTCYGIPRTYFPVRKGGKITFYQDAHVPRDLLPKIMLDDGKYFEHRQCWEEICHAILEAHHLIYIAGWSIYQKVRLVREPTRPLPISKNFTLGELLKYKSEEGVRVLLLVWDDKTSHHNFLIKTEGVMQTHDEETRRFFKHSSVQCVLAPRYASSKLSWFKQQVVGTLYTHHQKIVIVDTQASGNNRRVSAFVGGLDLCDGRYDTPEHRLFEDLDTVYKDDFHNPTFLPNKECQGPRQPWHDLHTKIEGPAAYDVLTNFEQCWQKATKYHYFRKHFKRSTKWYDDSLLKIERISWILSPSEMHNISNDDPKLWVSEGDSKDTFHVQIFRSTDSGSVKGFPKNAKEIENQNLVCRKNLVIDKSIHKAYVKAIRSAQHFIYIENQYFIGSSFNWLSHKNAGASNLVPMELALKIVSKIRKREKFCVYILIPMWPEGDPNSQSVQEILFWQSQTMEMMYRIIAKAIFDEGLEADHHPQHFLNFYCLGKREQRQENKQFAQKAPEENTSHGKAQRHKRFMIYVHSKGMIVDDEYALIGSANINERSLEGSRDTEIAMGCYQPNYTWACRSCHPHGQIYGYRMSLWSEHLGHLDPSFDHPESLECVQKVNQIAEENWKRFTAEETSQLTGHLLKYPLKVEADGKVVPLSDHDTFPDVGGKILGAPSSLPANLTT